MAGEKRKELSLEQRWKIINCHKIKNLSVKISEITGFKNRWCLTRLIVLKRQTVQKIYHEVVVRLRYLHQIIVIYGCAHYVIVTNL
jgi:hypothetical protein